MRRQQKEPPPLQRQGDHGPGALQDVEVLESNGQAAAVERPNTDEPVDDEVDENGQRRGHNRPPCGPPPPPRAPWPRNQEPPPRATNRQFPPIRPPTPHQPTPRPR